MVRWQAQQVPTDYGLLEGWNFDQTHHGPYHDLAEVWELERDQVEYETPTDYPPSVDAGQGSAEETVPESFEKKRSKKKG